MKRNLFLLFVVLQLIVQNATLIEDWVLFVYDFFEKEPLITIFDNRSNFLIDL